MNVFLYIVFYVAIAGFAFGLGIWVGRAQTERHALEKARMRLAKQEAKGKHAARQRAILDGDVPRVRTAMFRGASRRRVYEDEEDDHKRRR